jgi:quinoprotein glucose dehydrogenase
LLPGRLPARLKLACLRGFRRTQDPFIERFLDEADPVLVLEAARAINDVPITNALPKLAALLGDSVRFTRDTAKAWPTNIAFSREEWRTWTLRRAVNAAFRLGGESNATAIAALAALAESPESVRVEALEALADWGTPPKRDRIVWRYIRVRMTDSVRCSSIVTRVQTLGTASWCCATGSMRACCSLQRQRRSFCGT